MTKSKGPSPLRIPLDIDPDNTIGGIRAARIFSNIVSPPVIFAVLGLALSLKELPSFLGLLWAALFGFWVSLAPILVVVFMLRSGRIHDLHMSSTGDRQIPYISSVVGSVIALTLIYLFNGPELLLCLSIFSIFVLVALAIITHFWLISIHAASITAAMIISGLVFGIWAVALLIPLVAAVSYVRLYLRRHTLSQVLAGVGLGIGTVWFLTLFGCFV